jgi:hypothetical protein
MLLSSLDIGGHRNDLLIGEGHHQRFALGVVKLGRGLEGGQHFDGPGQDGNQEESQQEAEPQGRTPNRVAVPPGKRMSTFHRTLNFQWSENNPIFSRKCRIYL